MASEQRKKFNPQKLSWFSKAICVHSLDFPIFYIECISERHFIVAGGGGSSNTGVHNQINILELIPNDESCAADLVMKYHTPIPEAIMAASLSRESPIVSPRLVSAGSKPIIYQLQYELDKKTFQISDYKILKDNKVKTEIKSVKYLTNKILLGGMDGKLHIWDANKQSIEQTINAHSKEIDEIDVNLVSQQILTLSRREGKCSLWSLSNYKLVQDFKKEFINQNSKAAYKNAFRSCRFAYDLDQSSKKTNDLSYLLMACNPDRPKNPSTVFRLPTNNLKDVNSSPLTNDGIMAATVNSDGKLLAIGTMSGNVQVFAVRSLIEIYNIRGAHYNIITNLAFLPSKVESSILTNSQTCALLSASIDKRIVLHRPEKTTLTSKLCKMLCIFLLMYLTFNLRLIWHP